MPFVVTDVFSVQCSLNLVLLWEKNLNCGLRITVNFFYCEVIFTMDQPKGPFAHIYIALHVTLELPMHVRGTDYAFCYWTHAWKQGHIRHSFLWTKRPLLWSLVCILLVSLSLALALACAICIAMQMCLCIVMFTAMSFPLSYPNEAFVPWKLVRLN